MGVPAEERSTTSSSAVMPPPSAAECAVSPTWKAEKYGAAFTMVLPVIGAETWMVRSQALVLQKAVEYGCALETRAVGSTVQVETERSALSKCALAER